MTEQESINNEVKSRLDVQDEKFNSVMARIDATNEKVDSLISEMRDRDNRRAEEIAEIRNDIKELYKTIDAKIDSINKGLASMQNQNIFVIIGVIAIAVAVFLK